jgi:hypothetical protein
MKLTARSLLDMQWKEDREAKAFFWEFNENERNNTLKGYAIALLAGPIDIIVRSTTEVHSLYNNLFCAIADGRYAGEDCREVVADAICWWNTQLSVIENIVPAAPTRGREFGRK